MLHLIHYNAETNLELRPWKECAVSTLSGIAGNPHLEPIAECSHVGIWRLHQFISIWDNSHRPEIDFGIFPSFEAEEEVTRMSVI
jgi:hypothetical protein